MVAKGIERKETFDPGKKDAYEYEVLGGTHLMLATTKLHSQGRMARIYCGLTDNHAICLGAMHQKSSSFCHDITYREEVHFLYIYREEVHFCTFFNFIVKVTLFHFGE